MGSTSSTIKADDIRRSGETGVINGLAGKAAGVQISRSSGDPGAGSNIQIRGQNTITGSNQPLVIIDGIPMSNTTEGDARGGVAQQSRLNDINPEDIASMQVLERCFGSRFVGISRGERCNRDYNKTWCG